MLKLSHIAKRILEAKQVGTLYHAMDDDKFRNMLLSDSLGNKNSFSRNKMYDYVVGREKDYTYQIELDGDKLSEKFKIKPRYDGKGWVSDEYEEYIESKINNVGKYIKSIIVIKKKWYNWLNKGYMKGTYNVYIGTRLDEISDDLFLYLKKYPNISLKVKEGHSGKILDVGEKELKWLSSMGIKNSAEEKIIDNLVGVYKDKKKLFSDLMNAENYIKAHSNDFYTYGWDKDGDQDKSIVITFAEYYKEINQYSGYDRIFNDKSDIPLTFCDELNKCVVIDYIRNKTNTFVIDLMYYDDISSSELSFYEELIKKTTSKEIRKFSYSDIAKQYDDMP